MKRIFLFLLLTTTLFTACDKETIKTANDLPDVITTYINTHFADKQISQVIKDRDGFSSHYEVYLSDGTYLEFNRKDEIDEIKNINGLPDSVIPAKILEYVRTNYPDNFIIKWEREDKNRQQIELNNDLDIEFDNDGNFVRFD